MVPGFKVYARKYTRFAVLFVTVPCALLAMSLARNVIDITLVELIMGLGAIAVSMAFALVRDERGYWFYAVRGLKIYEPEVQREWVLSHDPAALKAKLVYEPLYASVSALLFVVFISILGYLLFAAHIRWFIYASGFLLLPLFLGFVLTRGLVYHLRRALVTPLDDPGKDKKGTIWNQIITDVLFSLLINFALVLPIARKPAFSLVQGYGSLPFIIAFLILLLAVLVFMLLFASKTRRYVMAGELLAGDIDTGFVAGTPWLRRLTSRRSLRYTGYLLAIMLWSILLCLIFASLPLEAQFVPLYLVGLLPILLIYSCERYQVLFDSFREAQDIHQRLIVSGVLKLQ